MFRACALCGRMHRSGEKCPRAKRKGKDGEAAALRRRSAWTRKSAEIREKAGYVCEVCRQRGRWEVGLLEVHHIVKLAERPEGLLEDENLICLCTSCHKAADAGEIDAEWLRKLAKEREG